MSTTPNTPQPGAPPAAPPVAMLDDKGNPGMVDAEHVDEATQLGYKPAIKMTSPDGKPGWIAKEHLDEARAQNYAVHPDNPGLQPMLTPDDKTTYALPEEVDTFLKSGHKAILSPEDQETLRSQYKSGALDAKGKKLEAQMFENSRKNMIHSDYVREQLKDKAIGGGIVYSAPVALAATRAAGAAVTGTGEKLLIDYAGKQIAQQGVKQLAGKAAGAAASLGLKWLVKAVGGVGLGVAGNAAWNAMRK